MSKLKMPTSNPITGIFDQPDVKNGLKTVKLKFSEMVELYNPDGYSAATLKNNKSDWISDVRASFNELLEFTAGIGSRPDATDNDDTKIAIEVKDARESFKKFLSDFNDKCNLANDQQAVNRADVPFVNNAAQEEKKRVAKIEADIEEEKVSAGVKEIRDKIDFSKDWSSASSDDIELAMSQISSWQQSFQHLQTSLWSIKKNVKCYNLDDTILTNSEVSVNTLEAELYLAIEKIQFEDKHRCLYSLIESNAADINYPTFGGNVEEDYMTFQKEMKNALKVNKIRLEDQVTKLRENLKDSPLKLIPHSLENIEEAFGILSSIYGDPSRVMTARKNKIASMGSFPNSKVKTSSNVKNQVEWLLSLELCIKDIFDLAEKNEDMDREAYNSSMFRTLINLFPLEVHCDMVNVNGGIKSKIEAIFTHVTDKREELQKILTNIPEQTPSNKSLNSSMRVNCAFFHRTAFVPQVSSGPSSASSSNDSSNEETLMDAGVPDPRAALEDDRICSMMIEAETHEEIDEQDERDENVNSSVETVSDAASLDPHIMPGSSSLDAAPPWSSTSDYTYNKEIMSQSITCIPSDPMSFEAKDDLLNVLTALETQSDLP